MAIWAKKSHSQSRLYVSRGGELRSWQEFSHLAKHARRYSLLSSGSFLASSSVDLAPVEGLHSVSAAIHKAGLLCNVPTGRRIWRGRMRKTRELPSYSASTIGSTPTVRASSNRLSPAGTSLFYGSADPETAVAEISAHDSRPYAAVAAFELIRPAMVIDLIDVPEKIRKHLDVDSWPMDFIQAFAEDISRPVDRDGREHLEYVPTQVLTEYFRYVSPLDVDGIRFHSAQNRGINYVLFVGPEGCVDSADEAPRSLLRLLSHTVRVFERS